MPVLATPSGRRPAGSVVMDVMRFRPGRLAHVVRALDGTQP